MNRKPLRFIGYSLFLGLIAALILVVPACSSKTTSTAATTSSSFTIAVSPPFTELAVGATQQYQALEIYSNASAVNITSKVKWISSDTNVATINSAGLATGVATGTANITATMSGVTSSPQMLEVIPATSTTITP